MQDHPKVSALMTGAFNQRSQQPKYTVIWDVEIMLNYLKSKDHLLPDKILNLKLSILLALISSLKSI